jgi:hypothetical protein
MTDSAARQPVLYLSHGAPPLADDPVWTRQLSDWSARFGKPTNILMVSAHWEEAPLALSSTSGRTPLVYDFWGFPQKYYEVTYAAPGAPELAESVTGLVQSADTPVHRDEARGLDHGAYVPLVEMYPEADVPVLQMSMPTLDPQRLFQLGRREAVMDRFAAEQVLRQLGLAGDEAEVAGLDRRQPVAALGAHRAVALDRALREVDVGFEAHGSAVAASLVGLLHGSCSSHWASFAQLYLGFIRLQCAPRPTPGTREA